MSTTHGPIEPMAGAPGAVPKPPRLFRTGPEAGDPPEFFARSGDTDVVFRLERDLPMVHRLRELASAAADRLLDNWRMVAAAGLGLLAVVTLALVVGGAYRGRPTPATLTPPAAAAPAAPAPTPAAVLTSRPAAAPQAARPARVRSHPAHARTRTAAAKRVAQAGSHARPGTSMVHRPR
jgi:hypothetical protein